MANNRFDYVKYDSNSTQAQANLKAKFTDLEEEINREIVDGRAKALVMTNLEQAYMWCGKGLRDDQLKRTGAVPLQEERNNS